MLKTKKKKKRVLKPQRLPANWFVWDTLLFAVLFSIVVVVRPLIWPVDVYIVELSEVRWSPDSANLRFARDTVVYKRVFSDLANSRRFETYLIHVTGENLQKIESADWRGNTAIRVGGLNAKSPDGGWVATTDNYELNIDGPNPSDTYQYRGYFRLIGWSPDSTYLAIWSHDVLTIFSTEQGAIQFRHRFDDISVGSWSPDSQQIAIIDDSNDAIWAVDVPAGNVSRVFKDPPGGVFNLRHHFYQLMSSRLALDSQLLGCCLLPLVWGMFLIFAFLNRVELIDQREVPKPGQEAP